MRPLLLLASAGCLLAGCQSAADTPADLAASTAGTYHGRLLVSSYRGSSFANRYVDTVLQVTMPAAATVGVFDRQLPYHADYPAWLGHRPARSQYSFESGYGYSNGIILQKETAGDSIYVNFRDGGLSAGRTYYFYGRR